MHVKCLMKCLIEDCFDRTCFFLLWIYEWHNRDVKFDIIRDLTYVEANMTGSKAHVREPNNGCKVFQFIMVKKSFFNGFQDGNCHPKMALVIDDRLKVWDDKEQSHVHVVPTFAPYYAPQAEANSVVLILRVATNVACNVRGGFFNNPATFLHAYTCLPLAYSTRQTAGAILQDVVDSGVLFAILMCKDKVALWYIRLTSSS